MKKTHKKLKVLLVLLTIIVPAVVLVGFYPRLERLANEKLNGNYEKTVLYIDSTELVNDAISVLLYDYTFRKYTQGQISEDEFLVFLNEQNEAYGENYMTDLGVSYVYNINDLTYCRGELFDVNDEMLGIAENLISNKNNSLSHAEMMNHEIVAYYIIEYDENGKLIRNEIVNNDEVYIDEYYDFSYDMYGQTPCSSAVFFLTYESNYIYSHHYGQWYSQGEAYYKVGTPILIVAAALLVLIVALLLPFIKSLNTGNEKIFKMPAEFIIILVGITIAAMCGMFFAISYTNMEFWQSQLSDGNDYIIGYRITPELVYNVLIVANVIAWILCFFAEYIVVSSVRQFVAHPIKFIKERFIIVKLAIKLWAWVKKNVKRCITKGKEIVASFKDNEKLLLVLGINLVVAIVACVFWMGGIPLFIIYTIVAYIFVYKKWMSVKSQFNDIKNAVHKMSEGDFDIHIDEDLGVFQPITDELVKVKDGFEKAVVEEAKSRDMKTELITNVSHDLKTPLTAIITYVDLLKKEDITEEERQQYIATLDMKSQRLKVLIEDLFEVSKANSGNVQMNPMDVDVVGLLKQVRLELEDKISESDIDFRWNLPDEKVILKLDGQKTYRIFANLINNITKYSLSGSRAFVEVNADENKVVITFKNISATEINCDVENLTERFVRGDASRNSEGSGLGLAIVKSFVELQGGTFRINVDGDLFKAVIEWSK